MSAPTDLAAPRPATEPPPARAVAGPGALLRLPDAVTLRQVFELKYGGAADLGWGPRLRRSFGYDNPDDWYEALLSLLVAPGARWLDVGCGREICPSNRPLAQLLSARAGRLVGLDPDPTLQENPFVHEKVAQDIDTFDGRASFDLVTLRMVAEHIAAPEPCVRAVQRSLAPGGLCVVYTVFGWSPVPLLTRIAPMGLRHVLKSWLWGTEKKDTFPTCFRMNTRTTLRRLFAAVGMQEAAFVRLDDCRTLARFRSLHEVELRLRTACRAVRLPYPEHCIVGIYRRP
ncbi:MAG: class I SAM-dependent methyltransferase [Planctomycetota bacterium]